jgi:TolB-like protein/DNA-binding winged helix-turn-helix (wHTH) protein/Tfp pilus assembly protein PilF
MPFEASLRLSKEVKFSSKAFLRDPMSVQGGRLYEFGEFHLDAVSRRLLQGNQIVTLTPKVFDLLIALVEGQGKILGKEELMRRLWPDTYVEEGNLTQNISVLRKALAAGSPGDVERYIETVPRHGYRIIPPVREVGATEEILTLERTHSLLVAEKELTGSPETGESPVRVDQRSPIRNPRAQARVWLLAVTLFALAVAGAAVWWGNRLVPRAAPEQIRSIAVLPLRNLSGDPEQEFFSDGTTEALISSLAQIHALKVISRTSVMRYKGTTKLVREIARELGVDAVVEGSVQRAGDRVRITAQLIQASTDTHLWANDYERDMADVLRLEAEVSRAIAQEIGIQVTSEDRRRMGGARRINPAAQEAYLLGRYHRWKLDEQDLRQSIDYFEHAVKLQPDFAAAYSGMSIAWFERGVWGAKGFREVEGPSRTAALKALELDPNLSEAHSALSEVFFGYDWNWSGAEIEHHRALDLDPNNLDARVRYASFLMALSRHPEAIAQIERAAALDPLSSGVQSTFGRVLFRARKYEEAVPHFLRAIELDTQNYGAYTRLAEVYEQTGKLQEALALVEQSLRIRGADLTKSAALGRIYALVGRRSDALKVIAQVTKPGSQPTGQDVALAYFALGDNDRGFQWLTRAFDQRELIVYVMADPRFDSVRSDPRFQNLVSRMGMPDLPH